MENRVPITSERIYSTHYFVTNKACQDHDFFQWKSHKYTLIRRKTATSAAISAISLSTIPILTCLRGSNLNENSYT